MEALRAFTVNSYLELSSILAYRKLQMCKVTLVEIGFTLPLGDPRGRTAFYHRRRP